MSEQNDKITVDSTSSDLSLNHIADIIDHASQLILIHRASQDISDSDVLDNLDEALTVSDVLSEENDTHIL